MRRAGSTPASGTTTLARHLGVDFGIMFLSIAVAAIVGPQLGARVAEASGGDYTAAFVVAAAISSAGLLAALGYLTRGRRRAVVDSG